MPDSLAERLYYRLPVFCQNAAFSLYGLRLWRTRFSRHFYERLGQLRESEYWDAQRIAQFQDAQVRDLVRHAYQRVPFYRRWYDEHGVDPYQIQRCEDLKKLPVLTKDTVRKCQEEMISSQYPRRSLSVGLTSGTTGTPLRIWRTKQAIAFQWAIWWRHRGRFGLVPGQKYLMFGARVPVSPQQQKPPFWREDFFGHRTYLSTYHMTTANLPAIVDFLDRRSFRYYLGYPSAFYVLAQYLLDNHIRLENPPHYVLSGSDALLPAFEKAIREGIGSPVSEQYGMAEFAGNLSKCEHGRFHVDFECCHVESIPLAGSAGPQQSLLLTGWGNPAMPFIRYEIGDLGTPSAGACPCGRQSATFDRIDGRIEDYVRTPDGRMVIGLNQVLEYGAGAKEIQIYQDRIDRIEVRVVPGPDYSEASERALVRELERRVGNSLTVKFVIVDQIPRTATGKFRAVVSTLKGTAAGEVELARAVRDGQEPGLN
jgi:phenylacetate-CoA ligase